MKTPLGHPSLPRRRRPPLARGAGGAPNTQRLAARRTATKRGLDMPLRMAQSDVTIKGSDSSQSRGQTRHNQGVRLVDFFVDTPQIFDRRLAHATPRVGVTSSPASAAISHSPLPRLCWLLPVAPPVSWSQCVDGIIGDTPTACVRLSCRDVCLLDEMSPTCRPFPVHDIGNVTTDTQRGASPSRAP